MKETNKGLGGYSRRSFMRSTSGMLGLSMAGLAFPMIGNTATKYSMRLGHYFPLDSYIHKGMMVFSEKVKARSDGQVEIAVYGGGTLGADQALSEQVRLGAIQMANIGVTTQAPLDVNFSVEELPYLWDSYEQITSAYQDELGDYMNRLMRPHGAHSLSYFPFGFRNLTNRVHPIKDPSDIKGLKIRVSAVPLRLDIFESLGAQPVPISFNELYTALQQGAVDGQENPLFLIRTSQFYEVQKYLSMSKHILNMNQILINNNYLDKMPAELREILNQESQQIALVLTEQLNEQDTESLAFMKSKGMIVEENVNVGAMREAVQPVYKKWKERFDPKLFALIERSSSMSS